MICLGLWFLGMVPMWFLWLWFEQEEGDETQEGVGYVLLKWTGIVLWPVLSLLLAAGIAGKAVKLVVTA